MSLPLTRYQRNKIFDPQQSISLNLIVPALSSEKVMLFSTATVWFDFSLWWKIFCDSRIMLDRDRSLVIRLPSPPRLDTRLRGHYPLILIMWEYKCTLTWYLHRTYRPSSRTEPSVGSWWSLGMAEYLSSNLDGVVVTIPSRSHRGYDIGVRASFVGQVSSVENNEKGQ